MYITVALPCLTQIDLKLNDVSLNYAYNLVFCILRDALTVRFIQSLCFQPSLPDEASPFCLEDES